MLVRRTTGEQEPNNKMSDSGDHPTALTGKKKRRREGGLNNKTKKNN